MFCIDLSSPYSKLKLMAKHSLLEIPFIYKGYFNAKSNFKHVSEVCRTSVPFTTYNCYSLVEMNSFKYANTQFKCTKTCIDKTSFNVCPLPEKWTFMEAELPDLALLPVNVLGSRTSLAIILTQMISYYKVISKEFTVFLKTMLPQGQNNETNAVKCIFGLLKYFAGFKKLRN